MSIQNRTQKIAIVIENHFHSEELRTYRERFTSAGFELHFVSRLWGYNELSFIRAIEKEDQDDATFRETRIKDIETATAIYDVGTVNPDDYAAIIMSAGYTGVRCRYYDAARGETPRTAPVVRFFAEAMKNKKIVKGFLCHGLWILTPLPELLAGRRVICHEVIRCDVENAGAIFTENESGIVADDDIVTGKTGKHATAFVEMILERIEKRHCRKESVLLPEKRKLGAQKQSHANRDEPGIRFGVYAPNALRVEVVFGLLWQSGDPEKKPVNRSNPIPYESIAGGYIADDGTGIDRTRPIVPLLREKNGCWFSDPGHPDLQRFADWDHVPYMFRIVKNDGVISYRTDLYSRCQIGAGHFDPKGMPYTGFVSELAGTKSCSIIVDPDTVTEVFEESLFPETRFIPQEEFWQEELSSEKPFAQKIEDLVIYQLHIPALGFGRDGVGSIADAIRHLDHLAELGVNAVELLPVSQYGGLPETWGYSTSHHHAVEFSGGGRDKMKHFIREAHRRGIAVIFDVVYNHYAHDAERAQWMYDTNDHEKNIYYWYHGHPFDYADPTDDLRDFPGCDGYLDNESTGFAPRYRDPFVRHLFISSAVALVKEFHVDGFRVDQTTSIHRYNKLRADGSTNEEADESGKMFLREWTTAVREAKPRVFLMAEDHSGWDGVTKSVEDGGLGFDAAWYADFHHHLCGTNFNSDYAKLIPTAGCGGEGPLAMDYFSGALLESGNKKIVYHLCHDEAGNAARYDADPDRRSHRTMPLAAHGFQNDATRPFAEARSRVAFAAACFSAGTPLFLFGEEVAFENDFLCDDVLALREDFDVKRKGAGRDMFEFYRDAIRLRLSEKALRTRNLEILHVHNDNRIVAFRRWEETEQMIVMISLNNHHFPHGYIVGHSSSPNGVWQVRLDSDAASYGGTGFRQEIEFISGENSLDISLPRISCLVLKKLY